MHRHALAFTVLFASAVHAHSFQRTHYFPHETNPRVALQKVSNNPPKLDAQIIGVMGSASLFPPLKDSRRVYRIGKRIAEKGGIVLTGACPGLPQQAVLGAKNADGWTIGISPWPDLEQHLAHGAPIWGIDVLLFTQLPPSQRGQARPNIMGRTIDNVEWSDKLIFAGGRSGSGAEFSIGYEEGVPIGVLTGTGGTSKAAPTLVNVWTKAGKPPRNEILYDAHPERLVDRVWMIKPAPVIIDWDN